MISHVVMERSCCNDLLKVYLPLDPHRWCISAKTFALSTYPRSRLLQQWLTRSQRVQRAASDTDRLGLPHRLDARRLLEEARPGALLARARLHLRDGRVIGEATGVLTVLEVDVPALSPTLAP